MCLSEAIVSANSGSATTEDAKAQPPLNLQIIAIPSSIKGEEVTSATLSGGGLLALGTAAGHLSIVDQNLRPWRGGWERNAGASAIFGLAFSQDEAAIAGITSEGLTVWRLDDPTVVKIPLKVWPSAIALSSDGRLLALADSGAIPVGDASFGIYVFDVLSQRLVREFEQDIGPDGRGAYRDVAFIPGAAVVAAGNDENIDAWNIESGNRVQRWSCGCGGTVAFSGDAALAVVGTADAHALLWELGSGEVVKDKTISTLEGDQVYGTAVSLSGTLVAAGTASGSVVVWDTGSDVIVARANPSDEPITSITSSHDGHVLLVEGQKFHDTGPSYDRWLMTLTQR